MDLIEESNVRNFLLDLLPRAGQILRRYFLSEDLPSKKKGKLDFVTAADLAVNKFVINELAGRYPAIPILTEETAPPDFYKLKNEKLLWVVDPLDGTANFARGDDNFSISIALVSKGDPIVGAIFAPIQSRLFWVQKNKSGAFWNGRRIKVSKIENLEEASVCTDWSHLLETRNETTTFLRKIYGNVRQIKILGSAATDITLLARGGVDIYHHVHLMPWDVAASGLLARLAGAKVTGLKGEKWNAFTPGMIAANPVLHGKLLDLLD